MDKSKLKPGIYPPPEGWKERCYYLVNVSYNRSNPVHRAIFYTGFLNEDGVRGGPKGSPGGYSNLWGNYDHPISFSEKKVYYLSVVRQLTDPGEMDSDFSLEWEDYNGG